MTTGQTVYFYYRRFLPRRHWVDLEIYGYLMAKRFQTDLMLTTGGVYFAGPIDPNKSLDVVLVHINSSQWTKFKTLIKAKYQWPKEL